MIYTIKIFLHLFPLSRGKGDKFKKTRKNLFAVIYNPDHWQFANKQQDLLMLLNVHGVPKVYQVERLSTPCLWSVIGNKIRCQGNVFFQPTLRYNGSMLLVVDFGVQTAHLIARRLRDLGAPSTLLPPEEALIFLSTHKPKGIILSGGPSS